MANSYSSRNLAILASVGHAVRAHRTALGLSQETLAEKAGINVTYVSDVERGRRNISIINLVSIAFAMDLTVSALLQDVRLADL